ncbi:MAG: hypothetical protein US83_C0004G0076 [Candidatus Falkowbacteria bacterium GW2011_GWC2_38_22]|uniref:Lipoprotein n=1 Tax=Candidatus Falkowbacteria bacterium GW2011_GWE1_38_31 TaxID=1618638 RepID=A0A0G0N0B4_9BACT|nr:MAG: hypothetical protein US73_C0002G0041 [Candidatus Falkowbacteria bacterium GW2011_GWF2_38_1205]KKQ61692.1 MAG: hypothetical protein US83_C0004G0076 [Candidatus Falkowbacteria bacterium GW2011_GWC2_38_22]KKQ63693.1 MAG: hypothetical protein US84_C0004G0041 [Candidatus Falkowbacteria bacterium GW2011_GWF1_38_22]KKQ65891.1 MAG: hypothetical protein US87_C0004G0076 [Candidatus Falkowbacteria bacterium GW2011_GWE2_38_254]KKQ70556.1 MAG: hypothetical protein US91_C0004G0041 [Candidatus Falkowb
MKIGRFIFALILMISVSGCTKLKWLDQRVGEIFFDGTNTETNSQETESTTKSKNNSFNVAPPGAEDLTTEQKEKIEKWLTDNNLNRYGDAMDTFYTDGTPLFDEVSGKSIERFEYILKKTPDILEKIGE